MFETVKPCLDLIGNKILYMGAVGSGQLTKLINQLLFDINAAALAEVLPMAVKMGLDPDLRRRGGQQRHRAQLRLRILHLRACCAATSPTAT